MHDEDDPIKNYSIKQRNQILINEIYEIFDFNKGKSWDDFRKELTDDKIKELYRVVGGLWNPDTEIINYLPKPDDEVRAFYNGSIDPRILPITVGGYSLYVDKIIMYSPFFNPRAMNEEYSPFENPAKYRSDTIKNISTIMELSPLIEEGIVEMIPDPCDFDPDFRMRIYKMAEARAKCRGPGKKDMDYAQKLMRDDMKRSMFNLPPEILKRQIKKAIPDISKKDLDSEVKYVQKINLADPLALLQSTTPGEKNGQMHAFRMSGNHEMALYLAQVTGSFIYTDLNYSWQEYQLVAIRRAGDNELNPWEPITKALNKLNLTIYPDLDPRFYHIIKEKGYFTEVINLYSKIIKSLQNNIDPGVATAKATELTKHIKDINLKSIIDLLENDYKKWSSKNTKKNILSKIEMPVSHFIPGNGISSITITQILLTHGMNTTYWDVSAQ